MGHLVGKDVYRALGQKLDNLTCKTPYTPEFEAILRKLYSAAEAELIVKMPYGLSSARRISRIVGYDVTDQLAELADRGLLMDVLLEDGPAYIVSPFVIGVFEFTMMRTRGQVEPDAWARLFSAYLDSGVLYGANAHEHIAVPPMRTLPHEASLNPGVCEVLDFDRASAMIARNTVFAMGACSCRHEKLHLGEKTCDIPLETCASMGGAAEYMIRHGFGRAVSAPEMMDHLEMARDKGLVLTTENVSVGANYLCSCCSCCCNLLRGVSRHGYVNTVLTSRFIVRVDAQACTGCGLCVAKCPVNALSGGRGEPVVVDGDFCLGCGVCVAKCPTGALSMETRPQQVLSPETIFERIVLMALERGNLQFQIFDNPENPVHRVLQRLTGAFLRLPPVKAKLAGQLLGSRFLGNVRKAYERFYGIDFSSL